MKLKSNFTITPLCLSSADRLMSLKQKCCRVKNYRFTFTIIMTLLTIMHNEDDGYETYISSFYHVNSMWWQVRRICIVSASKAEA